MGRSPEDPKRPTCPTSPPLALLCHRAAGRLPAPREMHVPAANVGFPPRQTARVAPTCFAAALMKECESSLAVALRTGLGPKSVKLKLQT